MVNQEQELQIYDFSIFTEQNARDAFGLKFHDRAEGYLSDWLERAKTEIVSDEERKRLEKLHRKLSYYIRSWNSRELREKFIAPIIEVVDFDIPELEISAFAKRELRIVYQKSIIQGKVEWMVAKGPFEPSSPFFFIHVEPNKGEIPISFGKYKKEKDSSNDPVGQLLATLFTAQFLNQHTPTPTLFNPKPTSFGHIPLYGSYILGRFWFFVRLKDKQYYISQAYNSAEMEGLLEILKMLKAQKQMIIELVTKKLN